MERLRVEKLAGRLEKVFITAKSSASCAYGLLDNKEDQTVLVSNGQLYLGKECIVKFDLADSYKEGLPARGNFITSKIPEDFISMNKNRYVLTGLWKRPDMPSSLKEINEFYNPGNIGIALYFPDDLGVYAIGIKGASLLAVQDINYAINNDMLPNPLFCSRVIIFEKERDLKNAKSLFLAQDLITVEMEPSKEF